MRHNRDVVPGLVTFDTVQEAEATIKKTYSNKEWVARYGKQFELRVYLYTQNPSPQYYIHMYRRNKYPSYVDTVAEFARS